MQRDDERREKHSEAEREAGKTRKPGGGGGSGAVSRSVLGTVGLRPGGPSGERLAELSCPEWWGGGGNASLHQPLRATVIVPTPLAPLACPHQEDVRPGLETALSWRDPGTHPWVDNDL